jgi:lysophospholipase L1-like esterase
MMRALFLILIMLTSSIANAQVKRVLVYGDSNSWGWVPVETGFPAARYPPGVPWPDVMKEALGDEIDIIVDALSGRTIDQNIPGGIGKIGPEAFNGRRDIAASIATHLPLDLVIIMLGTNDLRSDLNRSPDQIAQSLRELTRHALETPQGVLTNYASPIVLVVIPPDIGDVSRTPIRQVMAGAAEKSHALTSAILRNFTDSGIRILDSNTIIRTDGIDGVHFSAETHHKLGIKIATSVRNLLKLDRIKVPRAIEFINGITTLNDGSILVGGITSGKIMRRTLDGEWTEFFAGNKDIFSITSLRHDSKNDVIWGASPDVLSFFASDKNQPKRSNHVFAIDAKTKRVMQVLPIPDDGFGNDIALDGQGGIFVTDSLQGKVWHLKYGSKRFVVAAQDSRFKNGNLGPAGIVVLPDKSLVIGLFSQGELYRLQGTGLKAKITKIPLSRRFIRADGLMLAPDGRLLVIEGGAGALHSVQLDTGAIATLADGLSGPVNMTMLGNNVLVTESGINNPAEFDPKKPPAEGFFIRRINLYPNAQ